MKILIDTNVVLDVALNRPRLAEPSSRVLGWAFDHPGQASIAWHSVATTAYFLEQAEDGARVRAFMGELGARLDVAGGSERELLRAVELKLADFEDAMVAAVAEGLQADRIVTRNVRDFRGSPVTAITPEAFVAAVR